MRRILLLALLPALALAIIMIAWPRGNASGFRPTPASAVGETCLPALAHASGTVIQNVSTPDGSRPYRLHVPPSYTGTSPVPIVIASHGAGSNALEEEVYSGFSTKSDSEGFIVAYPEGKISPLGFTFFNAWQLGTPNDVAYVSAILNALEAQLCVDRSRVYATGISNGGMISVRLACSLSSRIAAIAPVAGAYYPPGALNLNPAETCLDTRSVPVIAFHGTADATVPFLGGQPPGGPLNYRLPLDNTTPDEDVMSDWAAHNGCTGARTETQIDTEVRLIEYGSCTDGVGVQLYAIDGGGHTWPGSFDVPSLGYTTHQISATDLMWTFFSQYTLPDQDADLYPDDVDNCPSDANFSQSNNDRNYIDHSPPFAASVDDRTAPNSDLAGDACDLDDDNDGIADVDEFVVPCPSPTPGPGPTPGPCGPPPCTPGASGTDPFVADSDGDRALDGIECSLPTPTDPTSAGSKPALTDCGPTAVDSDGDRLTDRVELCYYGTNPNSTDSDGDKALDGGIDGCEATSFNGDRVVNIADQGMLAQAITGGPPWYHPTLDVNKDGALNIADVGLVASFRSPSGQCPG